MTLPSDEHDSRHQESSLRQHQISDAAPEFPVPVKYNQGPGRETASEPHQRD
ncbi:hypothetical protein J6590_037993 [Homalodisca vitripennis]|nr:hypothetical protein J6590_037993 [Homalodisca vitripennis]